jgi:type VI secretion system protein ImpF
MRDLAWLLNTDDLTCTEDLDAHPLVTQSVLNYGRPPMAGHTLSSADARTVERQLRQAICNFEPRIRPNTLKVRAILSDDKMNANALSFDIEGQLWAQPAPLRLLLKTEIDLETGDVKVTDRGSG